MVQQVFSSPYLTNTSLTWSAAQCCHTSPMQQQITYLIHCTVLPHLTNAATDHLPDPLHSAATPHQCSNRSLTWSAAQCCHTSPMQQQITYLIHCTVLPHLTNTATDHLPGGTDDAPLFIRQHVVTAHLLDLKNSMAERCWLTLPTQQQITHLEALMTLHSSSPSESSEITYLEALMTLHSSSPSVSSQITYLEALMTLHSSSPSVSSQITYLEALMTLHSSSPSVSSQITYLEALMTLHSSSPSVLSQITYLEALMTLHSSSPSVSSAMFSLETSASFDTRIFSAATSSSSDGPPGDRHSTEGVRWNSTVVFWFVLQYEN